MMAYDKSYYHKPHVCAVECTQVKSKRIPRMLHKLCFVTVSVFKMIPLILLELNSGQ